MRRKDRILMCCMGALLVAAGIAVVAWLPSGGNAAWFPVVLGAAFASLGLGGILQIVRSRVILTADVIEVRGWIRHKRLERATISAYRWTTTGHGPAILTIYSASDKPAGGLRVPQGVELDARFEAWLAGFPNREVEERRALAEWYFTHSTTPGSRAEKEQALASARRVARVLAFTSIAAALWLILHPLPLMIAFFVNAILPLVALGLAASAERAYVFSMDKSKVLADLTVPVIFPSAALIVQGLLTGERLDYSRLFSMIGIATVAGTVAVLWLAVSIPRRWGQAGKALAATALYFGGAIPLANRALDFATPEVFATEVLEKYAAGSSKSKQYHLRLAPWGLPHALTRVEVPRAFYEKAAVGGAVCVSLSPGALGMRWFEVDSCARAER